MHTLLMLGLAAAGALVEPSSWQWRGRLDTGQTLSIRAITGDIHALPSQSGDVEIEASVAGGDTDKVHVQVSPGAGGLDVSAAGKSGARIRWAVRVPAGVGLVARTVDGEITADSLKTSVDASTVNGSVYIETSGPAVARTVNGAIRANLLDGERTAPATLGAVNGEIKLRIPKSIRASIKADTSNGKVLARGLRQFRGKSADQSLAGAVGRGSARSAIRVQTRNGAIEISM